MIRVVAALLSAWAILGLVVIVRWLIVSKRSGKR